ncbi:MAG: hypothetical protein ACR2G6_16720 [Gemmatimonadaceae bacterium]
MMPALARAVSAHLRHNPATALMVLLALSARVAFAQAHQTLPVLAFPEPGLDDTAAYQGYQTRFFRDSRANVVQVYLDARSGRVVNLWADAFNESGGFTIRDGAGRPVRLAWGSDGAVVTDAGARRTIEYHLTADAPRIDIGWILLGSMRVERDLQYSRRHLEPFGAPTFRLRELEELIANLQRLGPAERRRHLALLRAPSIAELRSRLQPVVSTVSRASRGVRAVQPAFDGRSQLALELGVDPREATVALAGRVVSVRSRSRGPIHLRVRVETDAPPLTALSREQIFNPAFLAFLARARSTHDSASTSGQVVSDSTAIQRFRWLERQVRGVELLSSQEKLMAGLPNDATYFGRDMMMTALMMETVWSSTMAEHVIASVLRKLSPTGQVSHEEALGGQAIRENAGEYNEVLARYFRLARTSAPALAGLARARELLANFHAVRENYNMLDDEFQLPVLAARYLGNPSVSASRKRSFLADSSAGGVPRVKLLLREMGLVAHMAAPYAQSPIATNLVGFPKRDSTRWFPGSWRDSGAGYANGRYAMDINAIWVPQALESIADIIAVLRTLGYTPDQIAALASDTGGSPPNPMLRDPDLLVRAVRTWNGAVRHFVVTLSPQEIRANVESKLRWLPAEEREYWQTVLRPSAALSDSLAFLALSLDAEARPIPVVNTDPATWLFLHNRGKQTEIQDAQRERALRDVRAFMRPYPVGLLVPGIGPLVANDAFAPPRVWEAFRTDLYHSPRVVWGREVNLFMLGVAKQISSSFDESGRLRDPALTEYVSELDEALRKTSAAVQASGLKHNELWSYQIADGRLVPIRYGASTDIQLWNITDLAVQFELARLRNP